MQRLRPPQLQEAFLMFNGNTTCVTLLLDLKREQWVNYRRGFQEYLDCFKNTLSLKANLVVHVDPAHYDFTCAERCRHDPDMSHTRIIPTTLQDLPLYGYHHRIVDVMRREDFRNGLALVDVPEAINPDYSVLILSKIPLMKRWCDENPFGTSYFCWLDAAIGHSTFPPSMYGTRFPVDDKVASICQNDKIHMLCRSLPERTDLNLPWFFKAHINRFGAACTFGRRERFAELERKQTELLKRALSMNLIDCEQSLWAVIYLENKHLIHPHMGDWYDNFFRIAQQ